MVVRETAKDRAFNVINTIILTLILIITLYPMIFVLIASISDPDLVNSGKVLLIPKGISFEGYKLVLQEKSIWVGYRNTIFYTLFGTLINIILTFTAAYALSEKKLPGRKIITMLLVFTMFFNGGMIPKFLIVKGLHMYNTIWALLIPNAVTMYNLVLVRNYMENSIPLEIKEAAMIDGCSHFRLFLNIIVPLAAPIMAVMVLFYGVMHWNSYFDALMYISDEKLYPLQLTLRNFLIQNTMTDNIINDAASVAEQNKLVETMKYALIIVSSLPLIIIYPFIQKYFEKGMMVGAVKG